MKANVVNIIVQTGIGVVMGGFLWVMDSNGEARATKLEADNIIQNQELRKGIVSDLKAEYIYSFSDFIDVMNEKFADQKIFIESQDKILKRDVVRKIDEREEKYAEMYYEDQEGQLYYVWLKQLPDSLVVIKSIPIENNFDKE